MIIIRVTNIDWDTDGEDLDLPTSIDIPLDDEFFPDGLDEDSEDRDQIADILTDNYDWTVNDYDKEIITV